MVSVAPLIFSAAAPAWWWIFFPQAILDRLKANLLSLICIHLHANPLMKDQTDGCQRLYNNPPIPLWKPISGAGFSCDYVLNHHRLLIVAWKILCKNSCPGGAQQVCSPTLPFHFQSFTRPFRKLFIQPKSFTTTVVIFFCCFLVHHCTAMLLNQFFCRRCLLSLLKWFRFSKRQLVHRGE